MDLIRRNKIRERACDIKVEVGLLSFEDKEKGYKAGNIRGL